ncbi:MAG TPA: export ABC transporter ATP-binding protein [Coriobacteriia bacterium]|nr:MAG: ABC transporter related protein [Actinobacteria bacterium 66_15]HAL30887.1 export ABC transporter ATP-binding protein [Coriobacteriia bacterium]
MGTIVEVQGLVKRFGTLAAVDDVSFTIEEGEVFGLLGPNGAGKTTTISMISCLIEPTGGRIAVDGHDAAREPMALKASLGVVPQEVALYSTLTAAENLQFWGRMYGLHGQDLKQSVDDALELAGLADRAKERVEKYSGGMKRRINIAAGILHEPRVLLMDEPTVGIDPQSRNHILETVKGLNAAGMTVLYTSHYMEEVEYLCDRIAIMDHGRIIAMGTLDELRDVVGGMDVVAVTVSGAGDAIIEKVAGIDGVEGVNSADDTLEVLTRSSGSIMGRLVAALESDGAHVTSVSVTEPNLESVFLHLTGKSLRD